MHFVLENTKATSMHVALYNWVSSGYQSFFCFLRSLCEAILDTVSQEYYLLCKTCWSALQKRAWQALQSQGQHTYVTTPEAEVIHHHVYLMFGHLAFRTPAGLEALTKLHLNGLHFCRDGLERVLVPLLAFQSLIQRALLFTDLNKKRDLTNSFLHLIFKIATFLSSLLYPRVFNSGRDV